ncbi:MAG TPA: hypothetical protein PL151_17295 [Phycisphaerae bacterium]|nr:hypothetical protein [Phycisphaerae bacterium]HOJ76202.1 hypothetical protein [Phycisphaerae bacterium]HOM53585.1 hypothetical protein [Phycisphaerae bacterium]HON68306.1 hypothetical protein [Phycisphaerae bacterium]HOQ84558.1 hypothetical protein [Phycisphaerae bacterium]
MVHSLKEASLYLMLVRCSACADVVVPTSVAGQPDAGSVLEVPVACRSCGRADRVRLDLSRVDPAEAAMGLAGWAELAQAGNAPPINRTGRVSRAIDVAGWLTLHKMLSANAKARAEQAVSLADRTVARQLQLQAGECIEEALKFYDADNDLPPEDAFFTEEGRRQFREQPDLFLRSRLVSLRVSSMVKKSYEV